MTAKSGQILGKLLSARSLLHFGGPAGGRCTLTGTWPHALFHIACRNGDSSFSYSNIIVRRATRERDGPRQTCFKMFGKSFITLSSLGQFVSDFKNHTIRKVVISSGVVTTLAGSAGNSGNTNDAARMRYSGNEAV